MLLLATDLDGTFLGGHEAYQQQLYRLIRERQEMRLVFVTGRGLETVRPLLNDAVIPNPDYIICDVGATIVNGHTLEPIQPLQAGIEKKWPGRLIMQSKLSKVKGLRWQEVPQERRCSFFFDEETDFEHLYQIAAATGCDVLKSAGKFVDVLPGGVNKGSSLKQLVKLLGIPGKNILVAGDTLNDLSLYQAGYKGVVVGEAEPRLTEATKDMAHVYQAEKPGCGGILESLDHFVEFRQYYPSQEAVS